MGASSTFPSNSVVPLVDPREIRPSNIQTVKKIFGLRYKRSKSNRPIGDPLDLYCVAGEDDDDDCAKFSDHAFDLIELFLLEVYKEQKSIDKIRNICSTDISKFYFIKFLEIEFKDSLDLLEDLKKLLKLNSQANLENERIDDRESQERLLSGFSGMLAMSAFSKFLESGLYLQWRSVEAAGLFEATAVAVTNALLSKHPENADKKIELNSETFARHAFRYIENREFLRLALRSTWLSSLIASVEYLPVGFSIATADSERRGFPFVYVNRQFELDTGYSREEIIGKNASFLHGPKTSQRGVKRICEALSSMKPVMISILNYRKDGSTFHYQVSMKPLLDQHDRYNYVIALHFAMETPGIVMDHIELVDRLMSILPDNIVVSQDSEEKINKIMSAK